MKRCTKCGEEKPRTEFYKHRRAKDGLQTRCKSCHKGQIIARYHADPETARAKDRARRLRADPQGELRRAKGRARYHANVEASRAKDREYYRTHTETRLAKTRAYMKANPERERVYGARKSAKRYGVPSTLTVAQWYAILAHYEYRCAYCGIHTNGIDHVIPFSKGGANSAENVVPCCPPCNSRKADRETSDPRLEGHPVD